LVERIASKYKIKMRDNKVFSIVSDSKYLAYFANEARGFSPNCRITARYLHGKPHAYLTTIKKVKKGVELLTHYGSEFFDAA
jgi:hypothetical protein